MRVGSVSNRYAKALFELAKDKGALDAVERVRDSGRDAHIAVQRTGDLMAKPRLAGLVAETTQPELFCLGIPYDLDAAGDSVAISIVWICEGENIGLAHRLEQPQSNELWRQANGIVLRSRAAKRVDRLS